MAVFLKKSIFYLSFQVLSTHFHCIVLKNIQKTICTEEYENTRMIFEIHMRCS